jgi:hypothetical protein
MDWLVVSGSRAGLCILSSFIMVDSNSISSDLNDHWFFLFWKFGGDEWFAGVFVCFLVINGSHSHSFILFRFYW